MEKGAELEKKYPFEVSFDDGFDWLDLTIDVELKKVASEEKKKEVEKTLIGWARKGVDEGYGGGVMHDWDEEENEWDLEGRRLRFWADMGTSDETALDALLLDLSALSGVDKVRIGSRYFD